MAVRWSPAARFQRSGAQRVMKRAVWCCCLAMMFLLVAVPLPAQQAPATSAPAAPSSSASNSAKPEISKEVSDKLAGTIVILKITDLITGFRASKEHEVQGLDVTQHGKKPIIWTRRKQAAGFPGRTGMRKTQNPLLYKTAKVRNIHDETGSHHSTIKV